MSTTACFRLSKHGTLPFLAVAMERITITPFADGPEWRQSFDEGCTGVLGPGESFTVGVQLVGPRRTGSVLVDFTDGPYAIGGLVTYRDATGRSCRRWGNVDPERIVPSPGNQRRAPHQRHTVEP